MTQAPDCKFQVWWKNARVVAALEIAHKIWGKLNAWNGRYVDLAAKTGLFALLDRSRYVAVSRSDGVCLSLRRYHLSLYTL